MSIDYTGIVLNKLNDLRVDRQRISIQRYKEICESCPKIKEIDKRIARAAITDKKVLPALHELHDNLLGQWLTDHGLPLTYIYIEPKCSMCKDTGYIDGKLCVCVRNEVAKQMFYEAGLSDNCPSFDEFDLSLFPENDRTDDGMPLRLYMKGLRDSAIEYAKEFPNLIKPNLLFYGKPGRGKTFLMDCIARNVIDNGYWTIRTTAFQINEVMAKALVDKADSDFLFECDLLIIDDLGSEPILNKVTISSFFNLFNERGMKAKPFILSTNLSKDEILKRYGDRIFSRITDQRTTSIIRFSGIDLRRI